VFCFVIDFSTHHIPPDEWTGGQICLASVVTVGVLKFLLYIFFLLYAKSVQRQPGSLTSINLKKTGILSTEDRKQEHQEDKRRSQEEIQDGEGRPSITPGSSPNQERRKQGAAAAESSSSSSSSIPRQKSSTKNLVNFFERKKIVKRKGNSSN
jgi:hypothetical protein